MPQEKALTATQSLKMEFKALIPRLPLDWRQRMKDLDDYYKTDKGQVRLDNIRGGSAAPTLIELNALKDMVNVQ